MARFINRRRSQKGFTLIELLIVVAIIGIIAAILIPNLLDALQKAKQKRTVGDIRNVGTAWFSWYQDQLGAASAGQTSYNFEGIGSTISADNLLSTLFITSQMFYIQKIPPKDAWGTDFEYRAASDLSSSTYMGVRSLGLGGVKEGSTYIMGPFIATDYSKDIVWADGFFVQYPAGVQSQ